MILIDGKKISDEKRLEIKQKVEQIKNMFLIMRARYCTGLFPYSSGRCDSLRVQETGSNYVTTFKHNFFNQANGHLGIITNAREK